MYWLELTPNFDEFNNKKIIYQEALLGEIEEYVSGRRESLPEEVGGGRSETMPGREECPFFSKTGTCRFGSDCSRNHISPCVSRTLLFPQLYSHFSIEKHHEYDTDISLEFDYQETYSHFL
jgi:hypothetical protein